MTARTSSTPAGDSSPAPESPRDRRERIGSSGDCLDLVEGHQVRPERLRVRTMNFGQPWRTEGVEEVDYAVAVPLASVIETCEVRWDDWVADSRRFPDGEPLEVRLGSMGWPRPAEAFQLEDVAVLIAECFSAEALLDWLGDGRLADGAGFVLNTVDSVGLRGASVVYEGRARRNDRDGGYVYQDT